MDTETDTINPILAGTEEREKWAPLGAVIDSVISADFTARGICTQLYDAALQRSGHPLTMAAALALRTNVRRGDPVLLCTGWPSRSWLISGLTETDGPVGAGHLARALEQSVGAVPIMVVEESLVPFATTALRASGLIVQDVETALRSKSGPHNASVAAVLPFTADWAAAPDAARELFDRLNPGAVVSIEMPGANADREFHNVTARQVPTELVAKADALMWEAERRGVLRVGVGDGGNELGMGYVADAVRAHLPSGERIAPATDVDILVVGCISNWAAVGVSAALAALSGQPGLLDTVDLMRITDRLSDAGAIDGLTSYIDPKNDGTDRATNEAMVRLLSTAVRMHLSGWEKG